MPTAERIRKVRRMLSLRQPDLRVVLEGVTIAHNASAVIRTCDAAGVLYVDIISPQPDAFVLNRAISTRAEKWVETRVYSSASECLLPLKEKGFKVAVTHLGKEAINYTELDYTQSLAIVFGSEAEGVSPTALELADYIIKIPMLGMVESLNLSVSAAIILYEALKQRWDRGFYEKIRLSDEEFESYLRKWLHRRKSDDPSD
ncbi:MAG: RNA methyltransferase [Clostridiales bacterium]|nr:RNA methyltransferase [Clostridiales bacterium]